MFHRPNRGSFEKLEPATNTRKTWDKNFPNMALTRLHKLDNP